METLKRTKVRGSLKGTLQVPGDKSISHRSVMIGSLANGTTRVSGFLPGADCLSTIACFRKMGIDIDRNGRDVTMPFDQMVEECAFTGRRDAPLILAHFAVDRMRTLLREIRENEARRAAL